MTTLASTVQAFFTDYLTRQRRASPHTIAAYRDSLRLLLAFTARQAGTQPARLEITDLDAPVIGAFLDHLEKERGNGVRTRNARLAAIHALFSFAALRHLECAAVIQRVMAIPPKRSDRKLVTYLTEPEAAATTDTAPDGGIGTTTGSSLDALHTQREHAQFLVTEKQAHYILVVKKNQPGLYAQVKNLPWRRIPSRPASRPGPRPPGAPHPQGRGRRRRARLPARRPGHLPDPPGPAAGRRQVADRHRLRHHQPGRPPGRPAQLAAWIRGHWQIEALHHLRDVSYGDDASQIRTGSGPQAMAALRNLAIGILKTAGHTSIAAACRHHARDATRTLETLGLDPA